eukprot:749263-Hanusia_phi.AAC.8
MKSIKKAFAHNRSSNLNRVVSVFVHKGCIHPATAGWTTYFLEPALFKPTVRQKSECSPPPVRP